MCYDQGCFVFEEFIKVLNDLFFGFGIHSTQAIIKYHNTRIFYQRPGNGYPLLLSAAEGNTPFSYHGLIAKGESADFSVNTGLPGSQFNRRIFRMLHPKPDIIGDGIAEQKNVLRNIADLRTERLQIHLPDIDAIHHNLPFVGSNILKQQLRNGGLATARASNDGNFLSFLYVQ